MKRYTIMLQNDDALLNVIGKGCKAYLCRGIVRHSGFIAINVRGPHGY